MSLNWVEINRILEELNLPGFQIQKAVQSTYEVLSLKLHRGFPQSSSKTLLIALSPRACRFHETWQAMPKNQTPLRFAELINSRLVNGWIEEAVQLGDNRIVRLIVRLGLHRWRLYIRLWSNAANIVLTDEDSKVVDAMRRLPKRGEVSGGRYVPEAALGAAKQTGLPREYTLRAFSGESFNAYIDAWYAEHEGALSLDSLRAQAQKTFETHRDRLEGALERLREKERIFGDAPSLKEYGDLILAHISAIKPGDSWLEAENFYAPGTGILRIKLDPLKSPAAQAEHYYAQYRKAKNGLAQVQAEITAEEQELVRLEAALTRVLTETNPLVLHKLLNAKAIQGPLKDTHAQSQMDKKRPGLSFRRKDWLILVGRNSTENDLLLRYYAKGNDLWLHVRDYSGSYVFIKQHAGKSVPLDILLDAGNLALFYSKGRKNREADLFYTPVKFLRRAKNGPKGLVIPTQEKNLHIKLDDKRLEALETCVEP
ncbi:MAG: NFACT RNA binding domain-containing protein [Treponema sp.]|jgi:predicted ribosome quality control (RQC) complex YloA/Tae2 family protein|nr:NFACT RNA binding domain-containing protein [Treponema sp.]